MCPGPMGDIPEHTSSREWLSQVHTSVREWSLYNSTGESCHTLEAGPHPTGGCHFPEGNSAHSRWSSAAKTTGPRRIPVRLSQWDCSLRNTAFVRAAGIPTGYRRLWKTETGGVRCARPPAMGCNPCGVRSCVETTAQEPVRMLADRCWLKADSTLTGRICRPHSR